MPGKLDAQDWHLAYTFRAASIREHNPLPFLLKVLMEVPGLREHGGSLFTILSELYSNALEHGLLQLDSSLKLNYQGFTHYYQARKERLATLQERLDKSCAGSSARHCWGPVDYRGGRQRARVAGVQDRPAVAEPRVRSLRPSMAAVPRVTSGGGWGWSGR